MKNRKLFALLLTLALILGVAVPRAFAVDEEAQKSADSEPATEEASLPEEGAFSEEASLPEEGAFSEEATSEETSVEAEDPEQAPVDNQKEETAPEEALEESEEAEEVEEENKEEEQKAEETPAQPQEEELQEEEALEEEEGEIIYNVKFADTSMEIQGDPIVVIPDSFVDAAPLVGHEN